MSARPPGGTCPALVPRSLLLPEHDRVLVETVGPCRRSSVGSSGAPLRPASAGKKGQNVAGGALLAAGFRQRQVCPGLVAVAAPVLLFDLVAGFGRVGDGAVGAAFGVARLAAKSRTRTFG